MRTIKHVGFWYVLFFFLIAFHAAALWAVPAAPAHPADKAAAAASEDKNPVVLSYGDRTLRASELEDRIDRLPPQPRAYYKGQGKRQFVDLLLRMELLEGEAIRRKLDATPEVKAQLEMARKSILADAAKQALEKQIPVSEAEARAYFTAHASEFEEIRVRHILIRSRNSIPPPPEGAPGLTPDEARAKAQGLRKKILGGADFAQLAKENSDDAPTAARGGDAGFIKRGTTPPPFEQVAFALTPGEISDVVETPFGFHIIRIESKRSFDELKDAVIARVQQNKASEKLADLVKQLNPIINESYFKTAHDHPSGEPIPSYELEVRPKSKGPVKGTPPTGGAKP